MARVRLADLNGPKWTSPGQNGPKWAILVHKNAVRNKAISTKMVVWTILDHFGPVHFPTVPQSLPSFGQLKSHFQIARFVIWASVQIAIRIAMPISYTTSQNNELFWEGSHCLKSLVICDSRFESQIAIAVKSRDLEIP